ncbi:MAG: putative Ig domain-containing protein, partial [Planctomycetes bacterium]|nr:putative Ig domain-containing protein [Planctomycetota bacterium]
GVQITTATLPAGDSGALYGPVSLQAINGAQPYDWSVYSGTLPAGLSLSPGGVLDGTPTGFGGVFQATIRVEEAGGATHERQYNIVISGSLAGAGGRAKNKNACASEGGSAPYALLAILGVLSLVTLTRRRTT